MGLIEKVLTVILLFKVVIFYTACYTGNIYRNYNECQNDVQCNCLELVT